MSLPNCTSTSRSPTIRAFDTAMIKNEGNRVNQAIRKKENLLVHKQLINLRKKKGLALDCPQKLFGMDGSAFPGFISPLLGLFDRKYNAEGTPPLLLPSLFDPSGSDALDPTQSHRFLPSFLPSLYLPKSTSPRRRPCTARGWVSDRVMSRPRPLRNHATCRHLFCSICKWARFWKEWMEEASRSLSPSSRKSQCHRLLDPLGCSLARSLKSPSRRFAFRPISKSGASGRNDLLGVIGVGSDDRAIAK